MKLLVIDGNSIVNRAFFGIKLLTTKDGRFTNAIYGFLNILLKLKETADPDAVAFAFDLKAPTFRHEMYDEYKAGRKGMPPELAEQMPVLKDLLQKLGYAIVEQEGYEADDILGTLSAAIGPGDHCYVATGDRDSLQLVRDNVSVLLASTKMGRASRASARRRRRSGSRSTTASTTSTTTSRNSASPRRRKRTSSTIKTTRTSAGSSAPSYWTRPSTRTCPITSRPKGTRRRPRGSSRPSRCSR